MVAGASTVAEVTPAVAGEGSSDSSRFWQGLSNCLQEN
jgi:hypothetical protein